MVPPACTHTTVDIDESSFRGLYIAIDMRVSRATGRSIPLSTTKRLTNSATDSNPQLRPQQNGALQSTYQGDQKQYDEKDHQHRQHPEIQTPLSHGRILRAAARESEDSIARTVALGRTVTLKQAIVLPQAVPVLGAPMTLTPGSFLARGSVLSEASTLHAGGKYPAGNPLAVDVCLGAQLALSGPAMILTTPGQPCTLFLGKGDTIPAGTILCLGSVLYNDYVTMHTSCTLYAVIMTGTHEVKRPITVAHGSTLDKNTVIGSGTVLPPSFLKTLDTPSTSALLSLIMTHTEIPQQHQYTRTSRSYDRVMHRQAKTATRKRTAITQTPTQYNTVLE